MGDHHELPRAQLNLTLLELDAKLSAHDEKQFLLSFVRVPHKLTVQLCDLDVLVVHAPNHLGGPVFRNFIELRLNVYWRQHVFPEDCGDLTSQLSWEESIADRQSVQINNDEVAG